MGVSYIMCLLLVYTNFRMGYTSIYTSCAQALSFHIFVTVSKQNGPCQQKNEE